MIKEAIAELTIVKYPMYVRYNCNAFVHVHVCIFLLLLLNCYTLGYFELFLTQVNLFFKGVNTNMARLFIEK